jgi:hypothetical protein
LNGLMLAIFEVLKLRSFRGAAQYAQNKRHRFTHS